MAGDSAREQARRAREKSARLERYAEMWEKGADGESHTAAALEKLDAEWTHIHDLRWPGRKLANIDHIAIGPGGIFVIDSKNWSGNITIKENVLRQNGYRRETAVAACADATLAVGQLLPRYMDRMKPVICFDREEEISGWAREVMLCSTANIAEMLSSRPQILSRVEVAQATAAIRRSLTLKSSPMPSAPRKRAPRQSAPARSPRPSAPAWNPRPNASYRNPRPPAVPAPGSRKGLSRFFVGLGIWFCLVIAISATLSALTIDAGYGTIPMVLAGVVSWLVAGRVGP